VVTVVRDGRKSFVKADELVVDDIVIFEAGKQIVADCVVRKGIVEVNESLLTGESEVSC
jgi:cation-transporting ATPase E